MSIGKTLSVIAASIFLSNREAASKGLQVLHTFADPPGDGANPQGLIMSGGAIYGTTEFGGSGTTNCAPGCGTVFQLSPPAVPGPNR